MSNTLDIFLEVMAFVLGTLISFAMSWYFFKKADYPSRVSSAMTEDVLSLLIQTKLGIDFNFHEKFPKSALPKELDTPHILHYWVSQKSITAGDKIHLLFRIEDTDFDFPGADNIEITELESNVSFPSKRQGHGYYWCQVNCPHTATAGLHTLRLNLKDAKDNSHSHFIKYEVV